MASVKVYKVGKKNNKQDPGYKKSKGEKSKQEDDK